MITMKTYTEYLINAKRTRDFHPGKPLIQYLPAILFTLLIIYQADAQTIYRTDPSSGISIHGTSTIHDWTSEVKEFSGSADLLSDADTLKKINTLELRIPVSSIHGDRDGMNSKTYDALKGDKFPEIRFRLIKVTNISKSHIEATGKLTVAGSTRDIMLSVQYSQNSDGSLAFTGQKKIKMTDFNVKPPTALLGAIRSGDEITVRFKIIFTENNNLSYN